MNEKAQLKLLNAQVTILGLDELGETCAHYLCLAGIGKIILVDPVKAQSAKSKLDKLNPDTKIIAKTNSFDAHTAEDLIKGSSVIIDCFSDWQAKLLASDVCMHANIPLIHAGVDQFKFHVFTMIPHKSACLRCVFSQIGLEDLAHINQKAVFAPALGMAGSYQASEAIKLIAALGTSPGNHLISYDALRHEIDESFELVPRSDCPDCG